MTAAIKSASRASAGPLFAGLIVVALAILYRPLYMLGSTAFTNDAHSSILLVLPISAALLWTNRRDVFSAPHYSRPALLVLVPLAIVLVALRTIPDSLATETWISLSTLLFVVWLVVAFIGCYGLIAFRRAAFPLLLLVLTAPLPDAAREHVIIWLQHGSAEVTSWLFQLAGVPFSRFGVVLVLPRVTIEVAEECSGIRSSMILLVGTLVLAHLLLKSAWSKTTLLLLLLPMTIAKNGLRIFVLATLGMYVDPSFLTGRLHHNGGVVFFALAFAAMWGIARFLQKMESRQHNNSSAVTRRPAPPISANRLL